MSLASPFLKWAGGKHRVAAELIDITNTIRPLNTDWNVTPGSRYIEPFLGSGAMYFALKDSGLIQTKHHSFLSDLNPALINAMQVVKDSDLLSELVPKLEKWQQDYANSGPVEKHMPDSIRQKGMYYKKRSELNEYLANKVEFSRPCVDLAALTIFLNKTCFNGLWRMNRSGLFNVPEGDYVKPKNICQHEILYRCNALLEKTKIEELDWMESIKRAKRGDLVYLDPPYMPLRIGQQVFNTYFTEGFSEVEQIKLANEAAKAASRGVRVIASNHDALGEPTIREIYGNASTVNDINCEICPIEVSRNISCKGHGRVKVNEVLIFMFE